MNRLFLAAVFGWMCSGAGASAAELPALLVDPYLRVQMMLAADKTEALKADAAQMAKAASELGSEAKNLGAAARRLEAAADLKAAREAFGTLSDALLAYAAATKSAMPAEIKTAHCPMVNKSWLQKGTKIQNPYYGTAMLECGDIKK